MDMKMKEEEIRGHITRLNEAMMELESRLESARRLAFNYEGQLALIQEMQLEEKDGETPSDS